MQKTHNTSSTLKERQRREREALIVQAAEDVLQEKGYYETSMDEIACRVGIAKGTIYSHFPGKEELVLAIFQRNLRTFLQEIDGITAKELSPRARLEEMMTLIYSGFFAKQTQLMSSIYNGVDIRRMLMEKDSCMKDSWQALANHVTALLDAGKQIGEFDAMLPTGAMLYSFFCIISPQAYERFLLHSDLSHKELVVYLQKMYFNGIITH
jgi:TetR/AcrR family fatty acid metabolism transcriptional regulator